MADKDPFALLQEGLKDLADRIDASRAENRQQFEKIDGRFEKIDGRFEKIDERFEKIDERFEKIDERFEKSDGRFKGIEERLDRSDNRLERVENLAYQSQIQIEGLRKEIQVVAEGVISIDQKLDRHARENDRQFDELRTIMQVSNRALDGRVTRLEVGHEALDERVNVLESRKS